jgi:hypothetical protein
MLRPAQFSNQSLGTADLDEMFRHNSFLTLFGVLVGIWDR